MTPEQRKAKWRALCDVSDERNRQHERWGEQNLPDGTSAELWHNTRQNAREAREERFGAKRGSFLVLLAEEIGEAFAEEDPAKLRAELVQVAAVAVQWIEAIDRRRPAKLLNEPQGMGPAATVE